LNDILITCNKRMVFTWISYLSIKINCILVYYLRKNLITKLITVNLTFPSLSLCLRNLIGVLHFFRSRPWSRSRPKVSLLTVPRFRSATRRRWCPGCLSPFTTRWETTSSEKSKIWRQPSHKWRRNTYSTIWLKR
jgi:hypothetical protein